MELHRKPGNPMSWAITLFFFFFFCNYGHLTVYNDVTENSLFCW